MYALCLSSCLASGTFKDSVELSATGAVTDAGGTATGVPVGAAAGTAMGAALCAGTAAMGSVCSTSTSLGTQSSSNLGTGGGRWPQAATVALLIGEPSPAAAALACCENSVRRLLLSGILLDHVVRLGLDASLCLSLGAISTERSTVTIGDSSWSLSRADCELVEDEDGDNASAGNDIL